jgi:hypothetical protein
MMRDVSDHNDNLPPPDDKPLAFEHMHMPDNIVERACKWRLT